MTESGLRDIFFFHFSGNITSPNSLTKYITKAIFNHWQVINGSWHICVFGITSICHFIFFFAKTSFSFCVWKICNIPNIKRNAKKQRKSEITTQKLWDKTTCLHTNWNAKFKAYLLLMKTSPFWSFAIWKHFYETHRETLLFLQTSNQAKTYFISLSTKTYTHGSIKYIFRNSFIMDERVLAKTLT